MNETEQAGCAGKQSFTNKQVANEVRQRMARREPRQLDVYRCATCGNYHIGTPSTRKGPKEKRHGQR